MILADSGLYECIATNTMGTKKVRTNVVVQRKPGELLPPYYYLITKLNANLENSNHRKKKE